MTVTVNDVKTVYPTTEDLSGYLRTATLIVSEELSNKGLTTARLDEITIYLTAHFATIGLDQGGLRRKRMGESDESYKTPGDKDLGLKSTLFGQQAILLDTSGTLAVVGSSAQTLPALFTVVGSGWQDVQ